MTMDLLRLNISICGLTALTLEPPSFALILATNKYIQTVGTTGSLKNQVVETLNIGTLNIVRLLETNGY